MIYCENIHCCTYKFNNLEKLRDSQKDKDIWAFAYKEDERALNLLCKPIIGGVDFVLLITQSIKLQL